MARGLVRASRAVIADTRDEDESTLLQYICAREAAGRAPAPPPASASSDSRRAGDPAKRLRLGARLATEASRANVPDVWLCAQDRPSVDEGAATMARAATDILALTCLPTICLIFLVTLLRRRERFRARR